jgi:hypothetical protein
MRTLLAFTLLLSSALMAVEVPFYSLDMEELYGEYRGRASACPGMTDLCARISLRMLPTERPIVLVGSRNQPERWAHVEERPNGSLYFILEPNEEDCTGFSCGNLKSVYGTIYPTNIGGRYVPTVQMDVTIEYPNPASSEDPKGLQHYSVYLYQRP